MKALLIILAMLILVSCSGGAVVTPPVNEIPLRTTFGVMDGGLGSTIVATISGSEVQIVCDARSYNPIHFVATVVLYKANREVAGLIAVNETGLYSEKYHGIASSVEGLWITDWSMDAVE